MNPEFDQETPLKPNQSTPFLTTPLTLHHEEQIAHQRKILLSQLSTPGSSNAKTTIDTNKLLGLEYLPLFTSYSLPFKGYLTSESRPITALENEKDFLRYKTNLNGLIENTINSLESKDPNIKDTLLIT